MREEVLSCLPTTRRIKEAHIVLSPRQSHSRPLVFSHQSKQYELGKVVLEGSLQEQQHIDLESLRERNVEGTGKIRALPFFQMKYVLSTLLPKHLVWLH